MEGSRARRNVKKRFARNDGQIPICLNSKRNELRVIDISSGSGLFRALSSSETFEIDALAWKKYISTFKKMEEHYILNFIRKKLNISCNIDLF